MQQECKILTLKTFKQIINFDSLPQSKQIK